jgi:predicted transcriptional regulator
MFKDLNPILHSQLRLAVVSILISVKEAEFTYLREKTNATAGNLSVQINKLKEAGYIDVDHTAGRAGIRTVCKGSTFLFGYKKVSVNFSPASSSAARCC